MAEREPPPSWIEPSRRLLHAAHDAVGARAQAENLKSGRSLVLTSSATAVRSMAGASWIVADLTASTAALAISAAQKKASASAGERGAPPARIGPLSLISFPAAMLAVVKCLRLCRFRACRGDVLAAGNREGKDYRPEAAKAQTVSTILPICWPALPSGYGAADVFKRKDRVDQCLIFAGTTSGQTGLDTVSDHGFLSDGARAQRRAV